MTTKAKMVPMANTLRIIPSYGRLFAKIAMPKPSHTPSPRKAGYHAFAAPVPPIDIEFIAKGRESMPPKPRGPTIRRMAPKTNAPPSKATEPPQ